MHDVLEPKPVLKEVAQMGGPGIGLPPPSPPPKECDVDWAAIAKMLPAGRTKAERKERMKMFADFDPTKNGYLSYAELEHGVLDCLKFDDSKFNAKPAIYSAYKAARNCGAKKGYKEVRGGADDFV